MSENNAPLLVVFPRGQLSAEDKAQMREVGIIAIEADDPKAVVQLQLSQPLLLSAAGINADAFVRSLLMALAEQPAETRGGEINSAGRACASFVKQLAASLAVGEKGRG